MADTKGSALPAMTTPAGSDILIAVDDPAGTPATQKVTFADAWTNYFKTQADGLYLTSVATGDIADDAVTFAKLQDASQGSVLLGAQTAGVFAEITLGANLSMTGGVLDSTGGTDGAAIHDNVAGEIAALTEKTAPLNADIIIIEDSADANNKKKVQLGNIGDALAGVATSNPKTTLADDDYIGVYDPDNATLANRETAITYANFKADLNSDLSFLTASAVNTQTGTAYTLTLGDANDIVEIDNAGANTVTIPSNAAVAFPIGTVIGVTQLGAGATSVQGDVGVTLNGVSAGSAAIDGQYKGVSIYKRASDEWVMQGAHGTVA